MRSARSEGVVAACIRSAEAFFVTGKIDRRRLDVGSRDRSLRRVEVPNRRAGNPFAGADEAKRSSCSSNRMEAVRIICWTVLRIVQHGEGRVNDDSPRRQPDFGYGGYNPRIRCGTGKRSRTVRSGFRVRARGVRQTSHLTDRVAVTDRWTREARFFAIRNLQPTFRQWKQVSKRSRS